jgi:transposase-like protein
MNSESFELIPGLCPYPECLARAKALGTPVMGSDFESEIRPEVQRSAQIVRFGRFHRRHDGKQLARFRCNRCRRTFSTATFSRCFRQKKRRLNSKIYAHLCSNVSQKRTALLLNCNVKTVVRKFHFLAELAKKERLDELEKMRVRGVKITDVEMDEMQTFERSNCLPLSIPMMVIRGTRMVLDFDIAEMSASGKLAEFSRKKYGNRKNERATKFKSVLSRVKEILGDSVNIHTDKEPHYPGWIKSIIPGAVHHTYKGKRGKETGFGEMKEGAFDPLFSFNHTAAMLRANINRLNRRTWCTTKKRECLAKHIELYISFHNQSLTKKVSEQLIA